MNVVTIQTGDLLSHAMPPAQEDGVSTIGTRRGIQANLEDKQITCKRIQGTLGEGERHPTISYTCTLLPCCDPSLDPKYNSVYAWLH